MLVKAGLSAAWRFSGKIPPKLAEEPRDFPCQPRVRVRVRFRIRVRVRDWVMPAVGLIWADLHG